MPHLGARFAAVFAVVFAVLLADGVARCGGGFSYGLDDPYIHLALAEGVVHGQYGINPGEFAAASSSIAYPLLLAPFVAIGLGDGAPLLYNVLAGLTAAWFVGRAFPAPADLPAALGAGLVAFALAVLLAGQALFGMEHLPHAALTLAVLWGLVAARPDPRLGWAIAALPLLRYEGLAAALLAVGWLAARGERRLAARAALGALAGPTLFAAWLLAHGQPALPASVLVKSHVARAEHAGDALLTSVAMLATEEGRALSVLGAGIALALLARRRGAPRIPLDGPTGAALFALGCLGAHWLAGDVLWMNRYTTYLFALGAAAGGIVVRAARLPRAAAAIGTAAALVAAAPILSSAGQSPLAMRTVHDQHYQLHRFVTERWRQPIAVNDIGWVAYRNEGRVLDLWGLASPRARALRTSGDPAWAETLLRGEGVRLAAVYDRRVPGLRERLIPVGSLTTEGPIAAAGDAVVQLYATDEAAAREARAAWAGFAATVPPGVTARVASD